MCRLSRSATVFATMVFAWLCLGPTAAHAQAASLASIKTPRGATQSFILIKPPKPSASVILFAGGNGGLGLKSADDMAWGKGNFLVRARGLFAAQGLQVAVIDAPSDHSDGMKATFRMSSDHASDITALAAHLKKEADVPVWLVGTSMGTWSAATGAIAGKGIDGLVLTSTITGAKPEWAIAKTHPHGVASLPLSRIKAPTLIVSHRDDQCAITPAKDASKLTKGLTGAKKVDVIIMEGGTPPVSNDPCEARTAHGFQGIEGATVEKIAIFIKANSATPPR